MDKIKEMCILENVLYMDDLYRSLSSLKNIDFMHDKTFLITGATGLICSSVVDLLEIINIKNKLNWKIILAVRNIGKAQCRFRAFTKYNNITYMQYNLKDDFGFPEKVDYIIHGASNAYPSVFSQFPVETITDNFFGLENIIKYVIKKQTRLLYISSSEVYGQLYTKDPIKENEYGYIDILNPRSSYPIAKRALETICSSCISEYDIDCVIVRPGHIYGPTASEKDNRVASEFMYSAGRGKRIILKSEGKQIRSYCYCIDCASAIIEVLFLGKNGEAYNISNKNSMCSIKDMAYQFAISGNVELVFTLPEEKEKKSFNPMFNSSLDSTKLEALGWQPAFSMEEGFNHSVSIIQSIIK